MKNRSVTIAGVALFSICLVLIAAQTFAPPAAAQNAAGYQVDSQAANGLSVTTFTTPQGRIKINLPEDMAAGDTVSGTVVAEPIGKNEAERASNLAELNNHAIEFAGQAASVGSKQFARNIPRRLDAAAKTIVLLRQGQRVATASIQIAAIAPADLKTFTLPTGGQQGKLLRIRGPVNGAFSAQDFVKIGTTILPPLAESPRSLVVQNTSDVVGPTNIEVRENGDSTQCPFRNLGIKLSSPKLNLLRGETTTLHVVVLGLAGMAEDVPLDLEVTTPSVITMGGGDTQHLIIHRAEVQADGSYSLDRTLTGITAGAFGLTATVRWDNECTHPTTTDTAAKPVSSPAATSTSSASSDSGSARTKFGEGRALLTHFKYYDALEPLLGALATHTGAGNQNGIGVTDDALGDLYRAEGQYAVALRYFQSARQAFTAGGEPLNATVMLNKIGATYLLMNSYAEAKAAFAQVGPQPAPPNATVNNLDQYKAFFAYMMSKLGQGRADYLLGQLDAAETDFQDLLAAASLPQIANFRAPGRSVPEPFDTPVADSEILLSAAFQTAKFRRAARFRAAAATSLGDVAFRKGNLAAARDRYNQAIQIATRDGRIDLMWAANGGLGRTLWAMSRRPQAVRLNADGTRDPASNQIAELQTGALNAYREALKNIEAIIEGSIRAHEVRTTFLTATSQVFDEAAAANAEMALAAKSATSTVSARASMQFQAEGFQIVELSRGRALLDVLADGHAEIASGVLPDLFRRRSENRARQQQIEAQLTGPVVTGENRNQSATELEAELERLAVEFEGLENQIKAGSPRYASLVYTRPLTLAGAQQQLLDDRTALLTYSLGDEHSYLWVVTRQGAAVFRLPGAAAMDQLAMDFRAQLIPARMQRRIPGVDSQSEPQRGLGLGAAPLTEDPSAFVRAANSLYKVAVAPAASLIGDRRLVIVADGALNFVPFEALLRSDRGGDFASLDYLVKTNEVRYAPSGSVIAAIRENKRNVGRDVLLVADPIFSANDARLKSGAAAPGKITAATRGLGLDTALDDVARPPSRAKARELARLIGTRTEAEQIAELAKTSGLQQTIWLDLNANEESVKTRDIQNFRVLHLATHGLLDAERPQFSGLVLSLVGNRNNEDGFLRTNEIFDLKLGAPLVMLSACESGLGKVKRGQGLIGLTRAFMYAGAPTVGVSLWSVADKPTAELMTEFYRHLLDPKSSPSGAMREAQLTMIAGKKYSAPFYWAPFVLVGEWK